MLATFLLTREMTNRSLDSSSVRADKASDEVSLLLAKRRSSPSVNRDKSSSGDGYTSRSVADDEFVPLDPLISMLAAEESSKGT